MKKNDIATLDVLLETGEIIYQQINRQVRAKLDITVYTTCNNWGKFEKSIKSRFEEIFMKDYSYEDFRAIALHILPITIFRFLSAADLNLDFRNLTEPG